MMDGKSLHEIGRITGWGNERIRRLLESACEKLLDLMDDP